jgi:hypothetical protein
MKPANLYTDSPRTSRARSLGMKLGAAAMALVLGGCVVAPYRPYHRGYHGGYYGGVGYAAPRLRVWAPFPIWFVPVAGYQHSEASYDRDRSECYRYAVRETGLDPGGMTPLQERAAPSTPLGAEVAAGAAVGAVAGGIVSSSRNAGPGMVIGALLGAAVGAAAADSRDRAERAERDAREAREAAARSRRDPEDELTRDEQRRFRGAMSECMERRGYRARY